MNLSALEHVKNWCMGYIYELWLLSNGTARTLPGELVGVGSKWKVIDLEAS
jgi:hypothetical protein